LKYEIVSMILYTVLKISLVCIFSEAIAFEFGSSRGLLTYTFPEERRPEMKSDMLALGFITSKEDAVLFRVDSGTSNDYMELEIVSFCQLYNYKGRATL
jgi:hypothetical protein